MGKQSQAWKDLEREAAKMLRGKRITRGGDFSESAPDVELPDMPWLKIDCKYRKAHAHHTLMADIDGKYCAEECDVPVLVTKHHNQRGAYVTIPLEFFGELLAYAEQAA